MPNNRKERSRREQVPRDVCAGDVNDDAGALSLATADFAFQKFAQITQI